MKKIITGCIIVFIICISLLPVSASNVSDYENFMVLYTKGGSDWYRVLSSPTNPTADFGFTTEEQGVTINFGPVFYSAERFTFTKGFTYQLVMNLINNPNKQSALDWEYNGTRLTSFNNYTNFSNNPLSSYYSRNINDYCKSTYSMVYDGTSTYTFTLTFHCTSDTEFDGFMPMFSGSATEGVYFSIIDFTVYRDIEESSYNQLALEQQKEIQKSIDNGFASVNNSIGVVENTLWDIESSINDNISENFNDLKDTINGDPADAEDNSSLKDDISDYEKSEEEINNLITAPIKLPDGTTIQVDGSTLINIKDFILDTYNAPSYEADVGKHYNDIFELFMPYVGTCVFTSLLLGLGISFLKGRV